MVAFDLWGESFIFTAVFSTIILVPCLIVAVMGTKMIQKLGNKPSQAPNILMGICLQFVATATITLGLLFAFFKFFTV